jgi:hypothetical protein
LKTYILKVGFPKEKQVVYPPKLDGSSGGQTVAQVASWNEHGTYSIPSRPFFSSALEKNKDKIKELISHAIATPKDNARFDKVGVQIVGMIKDSIVNGNWQENSQKTKVSALPPSLQKAWKKPNTRLHEKAKQAVANKRPLIDRSIMLRSVTYTVTEE